MKTFDEYLAESTRPTEPRELLSVASATSNGMLIDDIRFNAKHWANLLVKSSRNYPSDGSIAKYHTNFINSVSKLHVLTGDKLKILWKFAEACWTYELDRAGL